MKKLPDLFHGAWQSDDFLAVTPIHFPVRVGTSLASSSRHNAKSGLHRNSFPGRNRTPHSFTTRCATLANKT